MLGWDRVRIGLGIYGCLSRNGQVAGRGKGLLNIVCSNGSYLVCWQKRDVQVCPEERKGE